MLKLSLKDIMHEHPITVKEDVSLGDVAHLLFRYRINGILVVDKNDSNKLIGIFATRDLLGLMDKAFSNKLHREDALKELSRQPVGNYATKCVVSLQKDDKVVKAIATMHKNSVHTIPVFDKDKLVGVVGRHTILNATFNYY